MKNVLVTGASRGIGRAIAQELSGRGYKVTGTCRKPESLKEKLPGVRYIVLDLTDETSVASCAEAAGPIDILVNNAGQSQVGSAEETSIGDYKKMFQVNFFGMAQLTSLLIPHMRKQGRGRIINIGSLIASFSTAYYSSYASTKAATQVYTNSLYAELKPFGIQVSIIEPHDVRTGITPKICSSGVTDYIPYTDIIKSNITNSVDDADGPEIVAQKVYSLLQKKRMRPFYAIGIKSKLLLFGKRFTSRAFVNKKVYESFGLADIK